MTGQAAARVCLSVLVGALLSPAILGARGPSQATASTRIPTIWLAQDDSMPTATRRALPDLPPAELPMPDREEIDIEAVVDDTGALRHARVARPDPARSAREQAALAAVEQWRFRAASIGRRPRTTLVVVRFTIEPAARADAPPRVRAALVPPLREPLPPPASLPDEVYATLGRGRPTGLRPPSVLRNVVPTYDADSMRAKVQGNVILELLILPDGTVGETRVTRSLNEALDREAMIAARYWLFEPATLDGRAVATRAPIVLTFRVQ
jgi:protein TonB